MPLDIFNPPVQPSVTPGGGSEVKPRIIVSKLGDGNTQRLGDGLNTMPATITLSWNPISWADAETIEQFLEAHADGTAFYYKPPNETKTRAWYWTGRQRAPSFSIADSLTVMLEETFDQ